MKNLLSRRDFFKRAGVGAIGLGFGVSLFDGIFQYTEAVTEREKHALMEEEKHALLMKGTVNFMGFVAKEITPNDEFYITTYSDTVPIIDPKRFSLRVEGLVEKPYTLTLKELEEMKDKIEFVTLECIGNPIGGDAISNALWDGVTLRKIIEKAVPRKGLVKTAFFAEDGYSDSIPYSLSLSEDVFLAYKMNGEPLPRKQGYPLRAIVPGIYGMKHVKWLSKIELVNYNFKGYWEKKGWSDEAIIPNKSQILMPMEGKTIPLGNYVIGGVAFAGRYGISKVQISLDNKKTWHNAAIKPPLSKWSWTLWSFNWIDKSGKIQESPSLFGKLFGSFPDGAKGLHSVNVRVKRAG
jgi:DMSO/TMAO reductase YedYZ molybdopterin-dependent catalytic subunit